MKVETCITLWKQVNQHEEDVVNYIVLKGKEFIHIQLRNGEVTYVDPVVEHEAVTYMLLYQRFCTKAGVEYLHSQGWISKERTQNVP